MPDYPHLFLGWLIAGALCCVIGAVIGMDKGQAGAGFFYGLLLGPIGLLLIAVADDERIQCPVCRELIHHGARVCPKCRSNMAKLPSQRPRATQQNAVELEQPEVIPVVPRVVAKTPRVVARATRAAAKVTQALGQVTQALGQAPRNFLFRQPRGISPPPQIVAPEPPQTVPQEPRIIDKTPRFFLHRPGEEVRGPFDLAQIQALMECGSITGETQFCREGENEWRQTLNV